MRTVFPIAAFLALSFSVGSLRAASPAEPTPDEPRIDALEVRAEQAQPRDQCFLYAQIVHQMTELSIRQYAAGDFNKATGLLKQIQKFTQKLHLVMGGNNKRLKNAELLLDQTAFRLNEMLQSSSIDDRPLVQETLAQVTDAKNAAMMQVFSK